MLCNATQGQPQFWKVSEADILSIVQEAVCILPETSDYCLYIKGTHWHFEEVSGNRIVSIDLHACKTQSARLLFMENHKAQKLTDKSSRNWKTEGKHPQGRFHLSWGYKYMQHNRALSAPVIIWVSFVICLSWTFDGSASSLILHSPTWWKQCLVLLPERYDDLL